MHRYRRTYVKIRDSSEDKLTWIRVQFDPDGCQDLLCARMLQLDVSGQNMQIYQANVNMTDFALWTDGNDEDAIDEKMNNNKKNMKNKKKEKEVTENKNGDVNTVRRNRTINCIVNKKRMGTKWKT